MIRKFSVVFLIGFATILGCTKLNWTGIGLPNLTLADLDGRWTYSVTFVGIPKTICMTFHRGDLVDLDADLDGTNDLPSPVSATIHGREFRLDISSATGAPTGHDVITGTIQADGTIDTTETITAADDSSVSIPGTLSPGCTD